MQAALFLSPSRRKRRDIVFSHNFQGAGEFQKPNTPEETILLRILDKVPKHIDQIAFEVNLPVRTTAAILLDLELRGACFSVAGKVFYFLI